MLFCDAVAEEVVVEPPLGDVVANADVGDKMPVESQVLDVHDVNIDISELLMFLLMCPFLLKYSWATMPKLS